MKKLTCLLLSLLLLLSLTGCGGSAKSYSMDQAAVAEEPMAMEMAKGETTNSSALRSNGTSDSVSVPENRKWIITVDMSVETNDLDTLQPALNDTISQLNGYIQDQSIYNGSTRSTRRYRNASLTVRIPAEKVDQFTDEISGIANVVSNNLRREDVTLTYVATESKVTALQTEEARLLELLAEAENMTDLLEIEARLSDVRYELENYASQLRTLDNQINYATIYLFIEEVQEYTPVEDPTFLERITNGFADSLKGIAEGSVNFVVWLITTSPYLVILAVVFVIALLVAKRVRKVNAKRKKNPEEK